MTKLIKIRQHQAKAQSGRCYYCQQPIWEKHANAFAKAHRLSIRQARMLKATAEHIVARCEGGKDTKANIVAACLFCNTRRHCRLPAPSAATHLNRVRSRMAHGKWHGLLLHPSDGAPSG